MKEQAAIKGRTVNIGGTSEVAGAVPPTKSTTGRSPDVPLPASVLAEIIVDAISKAGDGHASRIQDATAKAVEKIMDDHREALKAAFVAGCCAVLTWTNSGMPQDDLDEAGYDYAASVMS